MKNFIRNIIHKKDKIKEDDCYVKELPIERYHNMDQEYGFPILDSDQDDDEYTELLQNIIQHIRIIFEGEIFCIRCGEKVGRLVKEVLKDYQDIGPDKLMIDYSNQYNIDDPQDISYCRTEIFFRTDIKDSYYIENNNMISTKKRINPPLSFGISFSLNNQIVDKSLSHYEKWLDYRDQMISNKYAV